MDAVKEEICELLKDIDQKHEQDPDEVTDTLGGILNDLAAHARADSWLSEAAGELADEFRGAKMRRAYRIVGNNQIIIVGNRQIGQRMGDADTFSDEDDISASASLTEMGGRSG